MENDSVRRELDERCTGNDESTGTAELTFASRAYTNYNRGPRLHYIGRELPPHISPHDKPTGDPQF